MKIIIKENGKKFSIRLPLFLIKSKTIQKAIAKNSNSQMRGFIIVSYKELKKFIKENGHFVFLDVRESDGIAVKIVL